MKIAKTSDTSALTSVYELTEELLPVFEELGESFPSVKTELFYCFRCLPDSLKRKTFRRFSKDEDVLYLDISFSEDELASLTTDEQRQRLSVAMRAYTRESLAKYRFPGLDVQEFMSAFDRLCAGIGWS